MKVAACGKWFDYLNMMPLQEGLILERLVEEYSDTEVFQNFENISVDTDLICLDADHTNYSILIQLAKKGVNVLCQGLWNVENYLDVIREFKRNNKFVIEDESFLNFEKVSIFVDIAKKLLAFDPAAEIEIKTNCFNIYAAVRILGMFLPNMQQMTVEQHVEQDSKEWVWCRLRNKIVVFEIDKKIYYGLERKYTAKSVEFNIQTDRGNLSLRGYLGPIIWEGFFPEISNNENSKGYLFHPTIQTVDGEANYDCYINTVYSNSLASEIKKTERYIKRQENVASKMQQQILNIRCSQELLSKLNFSLKCKKEYHPLLLEELLDLRTESEIENIFDNFSQEYIQYSVEMRKKILAQTILFYMNKKGVLLKDIPCTLNQILKCLSVNTDNNDIIYRWIELLKKYNYVTETDGIYVCKIEIYEKGLKYGWEEVEYLWKGKLESPLVLDYIINNIKNWDKLIQKEQQATLLLFEQGEDIYADALYKETKILQYLNHSLSKKVLGYLYENANATILEIGAGTGATSDKVLSDIRENKFEEHIVYFYTDISRFFLQRAKERYKECDGKIEMHYQTLDIDEAFSSQLPSNFQADIVIAVGVLNNSVNTDKCIYEINSVMKPGGILLIIETVEDVPDIDIIDGKIILIAHSLGCRIAQMCLEEIYSSIQSVVLITPMPVRNNFLQLLQMSKKQRKNNLEYILFSERLDSEQKEYYMSLLDKESKKVEYAMMKRQKKFSIYVRKIPTLVIGSYNDQCVILQAVKDNAKIHTAELKIVDSVCHDMMLDPDWRNIADLIFKFIEKTIDKKSGDNYNDNYVSTQAHQGGE